MKTPNEILDRLLKILDYYSYNNRYEPTENYNDKNTDAFKIEDFGEHPEMLEFLCEFVNLLHKYNVKPRGFNGWWNTLVFNPTDNDYTNDKTKRIGTSILYYLLLSDKEIDTMLSCLDKQLQKK